MSDMAVQVTGLTKNYDGFSLSNISFDVVKGSIMGIFGHSGSGKSLTLSAMMNMISIDGGKIRILGYDISKVEKQVKQEISVIYGDYLFDDGLTVTGLNPIFKNIYKNWSQETYFAYLEKIGILPNTNISYLPKGTNIMIQLAAAMSHESKLIIIDEPFRDVDEMYVPKIKTLLMEFVKDGENSVLYFSEKVSDFDEVANQVAIIDKGKILLTMRKDRLLSTHGIIAYVKGKPFRMDAALIAGFEKNENGAQILINNVEEFKKRYPDMDIRPATLEEVMKYYIIDNTDKS